MPVGGRPTEVWKAAIAALGDRGNEAAGETLFQLASDENLETPKRRLAIATLNDVTWLTLDGLQNG